MGNPASFYRILSNSQSTPIIAFTIIKLSGSQQWLFTFLDYSSVLTLLRKIWFTILSIRITLYNHNRHWKSCKRNKILLVQGGQIYYSPPKPKSIYDLIVILIYNYAFSTILGQYFMTLLLLNLTKIENSFIMFTSLLRLAQWLEEYSDQPSHRCGFSESRLQ